ncbi:hypothetical protein PQX77_006891, partial [Marasmius sp. AFHP31]
VIENVQGRIQAVYGTSASANEPSSSAGGTRLSSPTPNQNQLKQQPPYETSSCTPSIHRLTAATASRTRLSRSLSRYGAAEESLFGIPALRPLEKERTTKRKRGTKKDAPTSSSSGSRA